MYSSSLKVHRLLLQKIFRYQFKKNINNLCSNGSLMYSCSFNLTQDFTDISVFNFVDDKNNCDEDELIKKQQKPCV